MIRPSKKISLSRFGALLGILGWLGADALAEPAPLNVCATTPDLASLTREVGGDLVSVTSFAKGPEDAHFVEARPSFVRLLHDADLFIQAGLEQEEGWAPVLLRNARNRRVLPGAEGFLDASDVIEPVQIPTTPVDRSMGHVHSMGNPHYLVDPLNGLRVAALIRDRLSALRPEARDAFHRNYESFRLRLGRALLGDALVERYGELEKLALLFQHGQLETFLEERGEADLLGGWLGKMAPHRNTSAVSDHDMWPYFADRFGLSIRGTLEPKPGIPPTTAHLTRLVGKMKDARVSLILAAPYYDQRHADFLARATGARVVRMAHQTEARPGTETYLAMIDHNVRQVISALE